MSELGAQGDWWREWAVPAGGLSWEIGPLSLEVRRSGNEWQVAHHEDRLDEARNDWSVQEASGSDRAAVDFVRFAVRSASDTVRLWPRPADRSLVATPRAPLHVLAGEQAEFFVSSPVWLEITVDDPPRKLYETPTRRLTDTWFGSSTREGEIAYALKTHARSRLEDVTTATYRAVTPVRIQNHGDDTLRLDRMNLPVPFLSIYHAEGGGLWTEAVTLVRREDEEMATFEVAEGPPEQTRGAHRLSEPRLLTTGHPLVRAFGRLLRPFQEGD